MTDINSETTVLVTGANGYIASWLVKLLLEMGLIVHATVRDKSNQSKVAHLLAVAESFPEKLKLFNADLFNEASFDEAMQGCSVVFHTASPFIMKGIKDPDKELIQPALQGTRNVLESANRTESVSRVILTSSVAAIYGDCVDIKSVPGGIFTEAHWNLSSSIDHQPYCYSKLLAEKEAWKIHSSQDRWDLVVLNPGFVLGPSLAKASDSTSLSTMLELIDGTLKMGLPSVYFPFVDVRDVAKAHIKAMETPDASGRHILVERSAPLLKVAQMLRQKYGNRFPLPRWQVPKFVFWLVAPFFGMTRKFAAKNVGYPIEFDNTRAKEDIGVTFRPLNETVIDHCQQIVDDGIVQG